MKNIRILVITIISISMFFSLVPTYVSAIPPPTDQFKVMTYNVEQSGINANWKNVVKEENPDIAVFVETGTWDDSGNLLLNQYCDEFNLYFTSEAPYNCATTQGITYSTSGEAVFSRYPIVSTTQIHWLTLDDSTQWYATHDFFDVVVTIGGSNVHIIGAHLKCCSGSNNDRIRDNTQEGIINYMDALGDVPIMYMGDLNSFSPKDVGVLAPLGDLNYGPMSMMLLDDSFGLYSQFGSTVHTFTDAYRTLNPTVRGYTYGHQNPIYNSRIDFIVVNQRFADKLISSTVGDTPSANIGSDHYSVDVIINLNLTPDLDPPSQVTNLIATVISSSQIDLTWTAATDNIGVTGYNIYRDSVLIGTSSTTSFSDTGLLASTAYIYEVSAVDASANEGLKSAPVSATTNSPPPKDTTPPSQVTGLVATVISDTQINLVWNAATDNVAVTGYNVYRNGVFVAFVSTTSFSDTGLEANTLYTYEVSAVDTSTNEGLRSAPTSATTNPVPAPPPCSDDCNEEN